MKKLYRHTERLFEKVASFAIYLLGNSITFILALVLVIIWLGGRQFFTQSAHESIRDVIHGITFLSLFIIQKAFNRFAGSLHLKVNELVASHEPARNAVINAEEKTEFEILELSKEYAELSELVRTEEPL